MDPPLSLFSNSMPNRQYSLCRYLLQMVHDTSAILRAASGILHSHKVRQQISDIGDCQRSIDVAASRDSWQYIVN